jgi:polysaccharide biosynthesis/export protein
VIEARNRTFSIRGAVNRQGQYQILQSDFRLLDALTLAGDPTNTEIDYVYIIRKNTGDTGMGGAGGTTMPTGPMPATQQASPDLLAPRSQAMPHKAPVYLQATDMTPAPATLPAGMMNQPEGDRPVIILDGKPMMVPSATTTPSSDSPMMQPMGQSSDLGAGIPNDTMGTGGMTGNDTMGSTGHSGTFEFNELTEPSDVRVIRIPLRALLSGELKYNVVIRPQDMVIVPNPIIGEYYMGGHVLRVGVYSLTARKITLKQAVISAGMLDGLAIPQRTDVIRRVGPDREVYVRVDLAKIFSGDTPDFFLKPNDQVMVGTNMFAPFIAAARGAFRLTYGFGFLYDRNFASEENNRGR